MPGSQWLFSIFFRLTITSNFSNIFSIASFRLLLPLVSGIPFNSKHSRLKYCLFPQRCLFNATISSCNFAFTFLEITSSDWILSKLLLRQLKSLLMFNKVLWNLSWYYEVKAITSSWLSSFKAASDNAIFIQIKKQVYLLPAIFLIIAYSNIFSRQQPNLFCTGSVEGFDI